MSATPICVIGAPGLIGVRHTQHCLDEPTVELTCVVDPTPAGPLLAEKIKVSPYRCLYCVCGAANGLAVLFQVPLYTSIDAMLAARAAGEVKVAGAILATPNATHVSLGIQLVEAGIHALVEKPMSTDIPSGR
jgi:predicted dehydrogenase